jgi:hypothetical protein
MTTKQTKKGRGEGGREEKRERERERMRREEKKMRGGGVIDRIDRLRIRPNKI